jgi:DNA-binding MarR family transcriptional regulator
MGDATLFEQGCEDEVGEMRAAIRRLRQANIAGVIRASTERNATEVERAWHELAKYADEPRRELTDPDVRELGPFARDSETSRQAAIANYPKQGTQRWRIIDYIGRRPAEGRGSGATRNELSYVLDLSENSIRPRVRELVEGGWIEETERTRLTDMGRDATVLVLTDRGRAKWREGRG